MELSSRPSENVPYAKIYNILDWSVDHGLNTTRGLNERLRQGRFADIVRESEECYNDDVENAANLILERTDELKVVIISGPSSSGKTTTTIKVGERLQRGGIRLVTLNVDNYFYDLEMHPKDEFGDYDFETPQALDLALISEHLARLTAGEEVRLPEYNFKTGKRTENVTPLRLGSGELILIDSLHGLYPAMTESLGDEQKFKLYLEPLLQMKDSRGRFVRWTDLRLIRRMLRDAAHRAYDPRQTLEHWHYVRSSEMRNIIPNANRSDYIVNTGMPYELPIYRARMLAHFAEWEQQYREDPLREDAYERAARIHALLGEIDPVDDESAIPVDSVLREFIGGSVYSY
jgi:uridine kinase